MTDNELFTKTFKERERVVVRIEELELAIATEQNEHLLAEQIVLREHYVHELLDLNKYIAAILTPREEKPAKKSRLLNLGIGRR